MVSEGFDLPEVIHRRPFFIVGPMISPNTNLGIDLMGVVSEEVALFLGKLESDQILALDVLISWIIIIITAVPHNLKVGVFVFGEVALISLRVAVNLDGLIVPIG